MTAKTPDRCCRNCSLWDIAEAKSANGRVLSQRAVRCLWRSTEPWPSAINGWSVRPIPGYARAGEGVDCPCFTLREP
jgi:hypothetical protein